MSDPLIKHIAEFVHNTITGFESGMYKTFQKDHPSKVVYLTKRLAPIFEIYANLYEVYFKDIYNALITKNDNYVNNVFDKFKDLSNHAPQCLLCILINIIVLVHFNLDRNKLNIDNIGEYFESVKIEIDKNLNLIDIQSLFNHQCTGNLQVKLLDSTDKLVSIKIEQGEKISALLEYHIKH